MWLLRVCSLRSQHRLSPPVQNNKNTTTTSVTMEEIKLQNPFLEKTHSEDTNPSVLLCSYYCQHTTKKKSPNRLLTY